MLLLRLVALALLCSIRMKWLGFLLVSRWLLRWLRRALSEGYRQVSYLRAVALALLCSVRRLSLDVFSESSCAGLAVLYSMMSMGLAEAQRTGEAHPL